VSRTFAALALAALLSPVGCRPPQPAAPRIPSPPAPAALQAALARAPVPPGLEGSGVLHLELLGRAAPAMTARFALAPDSGRATLRPGMLPPILSLWISSRDWQLRLPRQRVVVLGTSEAADAGAGATDLARLLWYVLVPRALAAELADPQLLETKEGWILKGPVPRLASWARGAEIWVDPVTLAIERWSLWPSSGECVLRLAYDPPVAEIASGHVISFVGAWLGARGDLTLNQIRSGAIQLTSRQLVPDGWTSIPPSDLPGWLQGLSEPTR